MNDTARKLPLYVRVIAAALDRVVANRVGRGLLLGLARLNLFSHWFWRKFPVQGTFAIRFPDGTRFRYVPRGSDWLARGLFWMGPRFYEPETARVFCDLARRSSLVLDIGANTGIYTMLACAANPSLRVVAFEPVPELHERLLENLRENGWTSRCDARQEAVANATGRTDFHVDFGDAPVTSSLHPAGYQGNPGYLIRVAVTTVDAALTAGERPDLVKLDVEGFEHEVLRGMRRVIDACAPTLIFECHRDGHTEEIEAILRPFGYRFWALRPEGPVAVDKIPPDPEGRCRNFLATVQADWRGTPLGAPAGF